MIFSNDDMDIEEKKAFITDHNTSYVVQPTEKKAIVFKIEDVDPPASVKGKPIPLPDNSNLSRVVDNIQETLRNINPKFTNPKVGETWRVYFETKECKAILSDMFWYCLVKIDKRPYMKQYKRDLLERISYNYVQVFVNVPKDHKEIFFENFYDCIAQGVFYSMFFSYPKSRSRLDNEEFKSKLFAIVSRRLSGITVSNQGYNNWVLDLGAGNVLQRSAPRSQDTSLLPDLGNTRVKRQTRRTLQNLRYSPFVTRYLNSKRYEAINSVPSWNMRYTLRNLDKEKETDRQYNYYKKLAIETERKAKERGREYQEFSTKIDEEIKEGHRKYRKGVKKLNLEAKKIIKEGVSEYSNKLVALGVIQKEEKKQGYIPLL